MSKLLLRKHDHYYKHRLQTSEGVFVRKHLETILDGHLQWEHKQQIINYLGQATKINIRLKTQRLTFTSYCHLVISVVICRCIVAYIHCKCMLLMMVDDNDDDEEPQIWWVCWHSLGCSQWCYDDDDDDDDDDGDDEEWCGASVGIPWGAVKADKTLANFVNFQQTLIEGWMAMLMMMTMRVVVMMMMTMQRCKWQFNQQGCKFGKLWTNCLVMVMVMVIPLQEL